MEDGHDQQTSRTILNELLFAAVGFMLTSVFFVIKRGSKKSNFRDTKVKFL